MADKGDKIIKELIDSIDSHVFDFQKSLPAIEKQILKEILKIAEDFYMPAKTVQQQAYNLKLISKIKGKLNKVILTNDYKDSVKEYIKGFSEVEKIQSAYFSTIFSESTKSIALLDQIKKNAIDITVDKLTEEGLVSGVSDKIRDMLNRNITTGGSYSDFVSDIKDFLTTTKEKEGALSRYARQTTNDSLNQYSAQYTKAVTDDLGLKWYKYVGSLIRTSRPFCNALIKAKETCMPYIHESQLNEIASGIICGKDVSTAGMIEETDASNLQINRGGYNCGHQLIPVSEALVPQDLRDKFK